MDEDNGLPTVVSSDWKEIGERDNNFVEVKTTNRKRLKKEELWDMYFGVNDMKVWLTLTRHYVSTSKYEQEWLEYIENIWDKQGGMVWEEDNLIYVGIQSFSKREY